MSRTLDSRYFEVFHQHTEDTEGGFVECTAIRPKKNPMILFSSSGKYGPTPIASLHFLPQDATEATTIIAKRSEGMSSHCDFQGLLNKDNCAFQLVLSNLSKDTINFNILSEDVPVTQTDPGVKGHGVNKVNELRPNESYAVKCDQKDNLSFVLEAVKASSTSTGFITVEADEMSSTPMGTYYYLSVLPIKDGSNVELFEETYWGCVDYFLKTTEPLKKSSFFEDGDFSASYEEESALPSRSMGRRVQSCSYGGTHALSLESHSYNEACFTASPMVSQGTDSLIRDSYASNVTGRRKVIVNSRTTENQYEFDKPSTHCVLGLSIQPNLEFMTKASTESMLEEVKETIAQCVAGQHQQLLEKLTKTYVSEECCVCLDGPPNTVFYQCGHQCCHYDCCSGEIKKCPLCRKHIAAKIKV